MNLKMRMRLSTVGAPVMLAALLYASPVVATPLYPSFLAVDINGYNAGGGQAIGPTASGYQGWEMAEGLFLDPSIDIGNSGATGLTRVFSTSQGNITANLVGIAPNSFLGARNRGANAGALSELTQDFVFAQRGIDGLGRHYFRLTLAGLTPGQQYEVTMFAREPFNGGVDSFQAWTDLAALGGLDGPGAWLDANFGVGAHYQPTDGGTNNPIPTLARSPTSGPDSSDPFAYSASLLSTANASGVLTAYGWADPDSYSGTQTATLLNGFQIGTVSAVSVPEPGTLALIGLGFGLVGVGRRHYR